MSGSNSGRYSNLSVLVVDDNEVNQKVTSAMLQHFNVTPDLADNGEVAIECAAKNKYDLILMDCQMPIKNGFETTEYIRSLGQAPRADFETASDVIIIAMTANASPDDMDACLGYGMNDFIAKPVELEIITHMLEKWFSETSG